MATAIKTSKKQYIYYTKQQVYVHTEHFFVLAIFFVIIIKTTYKFPLSADILWMRANTPQMDFLSPTKLMWLIPRNQFREIYLLFSVI